MKKRISPKIILLLIISVVFGQLSAQRPSELRKMKEENKVKEAVFGDDDADFSLTEVPDKWKNESAVIISQKIVVEYLYENRRLKTRETIRKRIKLLDQAAVKKFSEFYYVKSQKIGIRIEKGDGRSVDVETTDAVEVEIDPPLIFRSYHGYKLKYNKLAIPDLEIGDIIDFYYHIEEEMYAQLTMIEAFDPFTFTLASSYPMMNQKLNFSVDEKYYISYNTFNGAPDLVQGGAGKNAKGKVKEKIRTFSFVDKDRDRLEDEIWDSYMLDYPYVKFQVYWVHPKAVKVSGMLIGTPGVAQNRFTPEQVTNVLRTRYKKDAYYGKLYSKQVLWYINRYHRSVKDPEQIARLAYYYMRYYILNGYYTFTNGAYVYGSSNDRLVYVNDLRFSNVMYKVLKAKKIPVRIVAAMPKRRGDIEEILLNDDLSVLIYLPSTDRFVFPFSSFSNFDYIEPVYEGSKVYVLKDKEGYDVMTIPTSRAKDNLIKAVTEVKFNDDMDKVTFNRVNYIAGDAKDAYSKILLSDYDFLLDDKAIYDPQYDPDARQRGNKARLEEYKRKRAERSKEFREEVKKRLESLTEDDYEIDNYEDFEVVNTGRSDEDQQLVYNETFTVKDLVNRAGNNYIFEVGKMITSQLKLDDKQRKERKTDIRVSSAKLYSYEVNVELPEGYTVEGYDKLNYDVDNEFGSFKSTVELSGNILKIKAEKMYKKNFVKKENWNEMIAFLDPAYEFSQKKVVLKKVIE